MNDVIAFLLVAACIVGLMFALAATWDEQDAQEGQR